MSIAAVAKLALGPLAKIFGGASGQEAQAKTNEEQIQLGRDRLGLDRYLGAIDARGTRMNNSVRGSMIKHASPVTSSWGGPGSGLRGEKVQFSGGYANPDLIDPASRELGDDVMLQELEQQTAGTERGKARGFVNQPASYLNRGGPPDIAGPPKSSGWDKLLGGGAFGFSVLDAILNSKRGSAAPVPGGSPGTGGKAGY